jgi:beta-mannosidase
MVWPSAHVRVERSGGTAVFQCDTFAWGVCIDLDGATGLPDNFFDVYPGMPVRIPWPHSTPPRILRVGNP